MMNTMTELFYGPVEPTWIVDPQYPGYRRPNENCYGNPYAIYSDDAYTYRRNPYVQRNAVPYTMVAPEGAHYRPVPQGMMYPYQAQYLVHGAGNGAGNGGVHGVVNGAGNVAMAPVSAVNQVAEVQGPAKQAPSPARPGVLQPRNVVNVQTVHFMVPLCCEKCESRVKEQLLDLDDVQRVTCDQWSQKVTVTSSIAADRLLKRLQKIKKRSTFWPQQQFNGGKGSNGNQVQLQQNQKLNQVTNDENAPQ
ncbi:hypothetical protein M758_11G038500 [Ceratodon purpureus]|nr:hypothetical protein M758_11G038500 [Ceratodon purpureus]